MNSEVFVMFINALQASAANAYPSAGMTVLIGLVVVFAVLLILTFIFWLFGLVAGGGKQKDSAPVVQKPAVASKAPVTAPTVSDDVPDEIVAVIAAAVAAMSSGGKQYVVRRIRPASSGSARPAWAAAGIADNTRPF